MAVMFPSSLYNLIEIFAVTLEGVQSLVDIPHVIAKIAVWKANRNDRTLYFTSNCFGDLPQHSAASRRSNMLFETAVTFTKLSLLKNQGDEPANG